MASGCSRTTIAAAALFMTTLAWRLLTFSGYTNDHYGSLALAQQMLLGDLPVRDFADPGWPLTYLVSAAAWWIAGNAMWVEWAIVATALAVASAFTVIAAHRLSGSLTIAVLVTIVQILVSPRSYAYPKILPYAAFAALVVAGVAPSPRRLIGLGLLLALAFLLRHDHGLWLGIGALTYLTLSSVPFDARTVIHRGLVVGMAAGVVLLPWLLFVSVNGGLIPYFETALEFARAEANASMLRALPTFTLTGGTPIAENADAWLFWLFWSLPGMAAVIVARRWRRGEEHRAGELAAVGALVAVAAGVNAGFLRDVLRTRFADAIVPAALLGAWLLGIAYAAGWRRRGSQRVAQLATAALFVISMAAIASATELRDRLERTNYNAGPAGMYRRAVEVVGVLGMPHRATPPSRVSAALMPFFEYLDRCTSESDRLIATGEYPDVVVLAGRGFGSDGAVFGAWYSSVRNQHRTLQRLRERPALFTILLDEASFQQRFRAIAQFVDEEYRPFATLETPGIHVPILVHGQRAASRVDPATGWPCFR